MTDSPIVIGGCYRSGTSLLRRILDAHPRIYCGPEVKFFRDFHGDYVQDPIRHVRFMETARAMLPEKEAFEVLGTAFITMHERAAQAAGKRRWADKVPENLAFLDDWQRLLADRWVLVHVARSPLDTLASIKEVKFPVSIPPRLEERIDLYVDYNRAGLTFAERNPDRYVRVAYEELIASPERAVRGLMSSLDEEFDPRQLAVNAAPHQPGLEDPKAARATEIHGESVGRWRCDLTPDEVRLVVERTADVWSRLDPRGRWPLPSL
jgi:protein-tyrosine sulfotransferase